MITASLNREQCKKLYLQVMEDNDTEAIQKLCREDLFFLLLVGFRRRDINNDWLFERCREVQSNPDGYLDLWAREHFKSSIITFAKSIQDILIDPEVTIGIFSHTRPIAKSFLEQIKRELEGNQFLQGLFPDILYSNPQKDSPKWSLDSGIIVKRKSNPKECTVEAWGLVDGQPTSRHFSRLVYDDVVTRESVTTPDQIKKTTEALELSYNLGTRDGKKRGIGTRYHMNDSYRTLMERGTLKARIYPATKNGKMDGEPVLLTLDNLNEKRRDMGPYTFSCQMLQDPVADRAMSFKSDWIKNYDMNANHARWNKYILVDPASKRKSNSDYTVMAVIGLGVDNNYYLVEAFRDRLNLTQRAAKLFDLHQKHRPLGVGYEQYGMQADVEHIEYEMEKRNYRFGITELGGKTPKEDRIKKLIPVYEQGRFYTPRRMLYTDYEGVARDYIAIFEENELLSFPVCVHDDMLDCHARILDPELSAKFPKLQTQQVQSRAITGDEDQGD